MAISRWWNGKTDKDLKWFKAKGRKWGKDRYR